MDGYTRAFDISREADGSPVVRVHVAGEDREVLTVLEGTRGRLLRPVDARAPLSAEVLASPHGAWLRLAEEAPWTYVRCRGAPTGLVTAWALPLLGEGAVTGFAPGDLEVLLESSHGLYERLPWDWDEAWEGALGERARAAMGAYAVFLGEGFSIAEVDARVGRLHGQLPNSAHCLFATAVVPGHVPQVLLTLFFGGPGG
jgi:hypothetical protein